MAEATIRAEDLPFILGVANARRKGYNLPQLCVLSTGGATISVDCADQRWVRPTYIAEAKRYGPSPIRVSPMQRGHIGRLFERVSRCGGRREVLRTWGAGIRALQAEPRYVLNGTDAS